MNTTQSHLQIRDIQDNLVLLKNGGVAMVLQTSAVNFDLLSDREQLAIIDAFAAMLNSLSFPIQIVIRSKRLNISSYLSLLAGAEAKQTNPLLKTMMHHYQGFVSALIREKEVLDKKFYVVLPVSYLELGIIGDSKKNLQKAATTLIPRKDHTLKLMARMGLKATQLDTEKLIRLFYDYYNESLVQTIEFKESAPLAQQPQPIPAPEPIQAATPPVVPPQPLPVQSPTPQPIAPPTPVAPVQAIPQVRPAPQASASSHQRIPFIVEELPDDYGTI